MKSEFQLPLSGQALWESNCHMKLDGQYFSMDTPPVEGLTVESVARDEHGVRIRFTDGSVLSAGITPAWAERAFRMQYFTWPRSAA